MGICLTIEGREALALRSIPYVTAWRTSPAELVSAFVAPKTAKLGSAAGFRMAYGGLFAYQMDDQGGFAEVPARQWQSLLATLVSHIKPLNSRERLSGAGEYEPSMRLQSILELPDNVFVWLDEFQAWFSAELRRRAPLSVLEDPDPEDVADWLDDSLCLKPILPAAVERNVWRYAEVVSGGEKPRQRQQVQEAEILQMIGELKYTPMALPPYEPGKRGVKSEVRARLKHRQWSQAVFDKAWERLLASNLIRYAT